MILRFEENCEFINGGSWTANEYDNNGYPVLKVSNFDKDGISYSDLSYLQISSFEKYKRNQLEIHDIVIATVGSHPSLVSSAAGRCISIPKDAVGLLLNQNAVCVRTKDFKVINQRYLGYLCKSQIFQHFIQQRGKGAANQMRIPISGIKDFEFNFPSILSQDKIASILSAYDDLIDNNLKRIKLLEEKAQLTYEEWFVKMRFPGYETAKFNELTGLPEGWKEGILSDLIGYQSGFAFKSSRFKEKGYPIIKIKNIGNNTIDLTNVDYIDIEYANQVVKFQLNAGDLLIAMTGATVGKVGIMPRSDVPCYLNQRVGRFLSFKDIDNKVFVECFFNIGSGLNQVLNIAGGAAQPNISANQILSIEIIVPSDRILKNFSQMATYITNSVINLQNQNKLLKEGRDILLPRLLSGMIDV